MDLKKNVFVKVDVCELKHARTKNQNECTKQSNVQWDKKFSDFLIKTKDSLDKNWYKSEEGKQRLAIQFGTFFWPCTYKTVMVSKQAVSKLDFVH
ncbi:hypothetical protein MP228_001678 [Amoeboaphelidium protococcarum]|nr:hypothetical protein MP228_001678 [Amoeboaphelidium protococcarum]